MAPAAIVANVSTQPGLAAYCTRCGNLHRDAAHMVCSSCDTPRVGAPPDVPGARSVEGAPHALCFVCGSNVSDHPPGLVQCRHCNARILVAPPGT